MRTITLDDLSALGPHWDAWERLADRAPRGSQAPTPRWFNAFARLRLRKGEGWFCCRAHEGDELVGVLPVVVSPHRLLWSRWPVLRTPFDWDTPTGDVLLDPRQARLALAALLAEARRRSPQYLGFEFRAVREGSPLQDRGPELRPRGGWKGTPCGLETGSSRRRWAPLRSSFQSPKIACDESFAGARPGILAASRC